MRYNSIITEKIPKVAATYPQATLMDVFTKKKRSEIMSHIKGSGTGLEKRFLKLLSSELYPKGFRYRKNYDKLPGKPDIAFVAQKLAIFIDGEFWHGHDFQEQKKRLPKKYWLAKIQRNIERDKEVNKKLRKTGWKVLRIWEREVGNNPEIAVKKIFNFLKTRTNS